MNDTMTIQNIYHKLHTMLHDVVPEVELQYKAELAHEILLLKAEKNALILGHNYMEPALFHSIPDFGGDSLELCRKAAATDKDIIVFCGVKFMAETAKILNPTKTVLLPSLRAGCSLAEDITGDDVKRLRQRFPGAPIITYINTYADVKAESDICCTSGNAAKVVRSFGNGPVIFLPDKYLGENTAIELGRRFVPADSPEADTAFASNENVVIGWRARCEVHEQFTLDDVSNVRRQFPDATILAHPECKPDVVHAADFTGSTSAMVSYVEKTSARRYLLLTECSMGDNIAAAHPEKEMIRMCSIRCRHMNKITLEDTLASLRQNQFVIDLPSDTIARASASVQRMLTIG